MNAKKMGAYLGAGVCFVCGTLGVIFAVEKPDVPFSVEATTADSFESAIAARIQLAQRTLSTAKTEFHKGMKDGRVLFLTIRLMDSSGQVEQVFAQVDSWNGTDISGRIASRIQKVSGYQKGQGMSFSEGDILDWTIQNPDGTSEGNYVGGLVEQWQRNSATH